MSSCLRGGYSLELEMVKSPPSHNTCSPSSTISETNSPPLAISTRRPRTSRKRPNQTYDEAEALLSTAYPNIFSSKKIKTQTLIRVISPLTDYDEASQLLLPFESIEVNNSLLHPTILTKSNHLFELKDVDFVHWDDFDAESILDEEIEEGIDSFMGNIQSNDGLSEAGIGGLGEMMMNPLYGSSTGFGSAGNFQLSLGLRRALRENDDEDWWKFPTVEFEQISPRIQTAAADDVKSSVVDITKNETMDKAAGDKKKKKKRKKKTKKKVAPVAVESKSSEDPHLNPKPEQRLSLLLKLDYDGILETWSDKESPFSDEILGLDGAGIDLHTRLGEIDLFGESGVRDACVLRYKEKRRNRLFSKNIRYQVRKLNADQRPRIKGRFVRKPNARNLSGLRF